MAFATETSAAEVDIVSDFVSDTVSGIADGVHGMLNFVARRNSGAGGQRT